MYKRQEKYEIFHGVHITDSALVAAADLSDRYIADRFLDVYKRQTISGSTALSDDEVDRMVKDAEAHAEEDKKQKEEVEVRNQTEMCIRDRPGGRSRHPG